MGGEDWENDIQYFNVGIVVDVDAVDDDDGTTDVDHDGEVDDRI